MREAVARSAIHYPSENGGGMKDPASAENRKHHIHRWVPWVAGFSSTFVNDVLSRFLRANGNHSPLVLDPFCGVGTTLVECQLRGIDSVGFEINPYAVLAAKAKINVPSIDASALESATIGYSRWMQEFETGLRQVGPWYL